MSRLPVTGSDDGTWGDVLNDFLGVEHNADGTQKTVSIAKGGTGATTASAALTNLGGFAPPAAPAVFSVDTYGAFAQGHKDGTGTLTAGGYGGAFVSGKASNLGKIIASGTGSRAFGYAPSSGYLHANGSGGLVSGVASGAGSVIETYNFSSGAFAHGMAAGGVIRAQSNGGFAGGKASGTSSTVLASNTGTFAHGYAGEGGVVSATGIAASAFGYAYGAGSIVTASDAGAFAVGRSSYGGTITASSYGAIAHGHSKGYIGATGWGAFAGGFSYHANATIKATGRGSVAHGYVYGSTAGTTVTSSGTASLAFGYARSGWKVQSSNVGSLAFGFTNTGDVTANGVNCMQFGQGANTLAHSMQIGNGGLRFKMTTGAPGTPQNGDIWVEAGVVKIRSNGITVSI